MWGGETPQGEGVGVGVFAHLFCLILYFVAFIILSLGS